VRQYFGDAIAQRTALVSMVGETRSLPDRDAARRTLGIPSDAFVVCSFGHMVRTKGIGPLLDAFLGSQLAQRPDCQLVLVGAPSGSAYAGEIQARVADAGLGDRIRIAGFVEPEHYLAYLVAADIAVQLRETTTGETSKAIADCLAAGL